MKSSMLKDHDDVVRHSLAVKKVVPYYFYAVFPLLLLLMFYYYPASPPASSPAPDPLFFSPSWHTSSKDDHRDKMEQFSVDSLSTSSSLPPSLMSPSSPPSQESTPPPPFGTSTSKCDYTDGDWVPTTTPPLYNGSSCRQTIKDNQNCMSHGRPDLSYLYYEWKPRSCNLPPFHPPTFLTCLKHKHLAFVGDSMARNQVESLICLVSSSYTPQLIYSYPENNNNNNNNEMVKLFRRWRFPSHNVTISVYWSPFLVKGIQKSSSIKFYNTLFLDSADEKWTKDLPGIDTVVLTIGHWYLHQAVYYEQGRVLGCNGCDGLNHTEIGFYGVFRKAYKTALNTILESRRRIDVVVTTFMPSHFQGEWDKLGACSKTRPYTPGEAEVEGMNAEMRRIALEEVEEAIMNNNNNKKTIRVTALDITKLSLMRPDGHPGPYMYPFPFADGVARERVHNDCLHFCLPGPIDTWNQIMSELILKPKDGET